MDNTYMSKGPGKIERAVVDLVAGNPDNAFTVAEACVQIYDLFLEYRVDRKHRVAVIRAIKSAIARGANLERMGWGGRGAAVVLYTPDNLTSYGLAYIKRHHPDAWTDERARERLAHKDYQEYMVPGGLWWCQVELVKARRAGNAELVAKIEARIEQHRKDADARFQMMRAYR